VSVSFWDQVVHLLWLDVGIESSLLVILLQECVLFLGVESGLALADDWLDDANTLRRKFAVLLGPLHTLVASLREESSSGVRVVQLVLLGALVGEALVALGDQVGNFFRLSVGVEATLFAELDHLRKLVVLVSQFDHLTLEVAVAIFSHDLTWVAAVGWRSVALSSLLGLAFALFLLFSVLLLFLLCWLVLELDCLGVVEWLALHGDVLAEILVTSHTLSPGLLETSCGGSSNQKRNHVS
jgi:hypothetical protein